MSKIRNQYSPRFRRDGSVMSTMEASAGPPAASSTATSLLRAVIVTVDKYSGEFPGLRCQCFAYSTNATACGPVWDVLLSVPYASMQSGEIFMPRECTMNMEAISRGITSGTMTPAQLDGDHVILGFCDGYLSLPVVVAFITHPATDKGKTPDDPIGDRILPRAEDGTPAYRKHRGAFYGIDTNGNYVTNTTRAHKGDAGNVTPESGGGFKTDGEEVSSTETDGGVATSGNCVVKLKANAKLLIEFASGKKIELTDNDGVLTLKTDKVVIGDGATEAAVLGNKLQQALTALTVPTAFGPSGPPINIPSFEDFKSISVKIKG